MGLVGGVDRVGFYNASLILTFLISFIHRNSSYSPHKSTVLIGELCNLAAYAFSPAVLVTPLGALSVVIRFVCAEYLTPFYH